MCTLVVKVVFESVVGYLANFLPVCTSTRIYQGWAGGIVVRLAIVILEAHGHVPLTTLR